MRLRAGGPLPGGTVCSMAGSAAQCARPGKLAGCGSRVGRGSHSAGAAGTRVLSRCVSTRTVGPPRGAEGGFAAVFVTR